MRVTAPDIIKTYYDTPPDVRQHATWKMRRKTFDQINQDVYPVGLSYQLMGRPVKIDNDIAEGSVKFTEENK